MFTPISVVDVNIHLKVLVSIFPTAFPCPITASLLTPKGTEVPPIPPQGNCHTRLQGEDPQLQQRLIVAVRLLLQGVFPKLQVKPMSCPALPGKEMQE